MVSSVLSTRSPVFSANAWNSASSVTSSASGQYAGITLDDLHTDWRSDPRTPYLSEYDAFYNFTSDFGPGTFYPAYGYRNGEEITLLEAGYFGDMLILAERPDGGFWFVEHSPSGRVPQGF